MGQEEFVDLVGSLYEALPGIAREASSSTGTGTGSGTGPIMLQASQQAPPKLLQTAASGIGSVGSAGTTLGGMSRKDLHNAAKAIVPQNDATFKPISVKGKLTKRPCLSSRLTSVRLIS